MNKSENPKISKNKMTRLKTGNENYSEFQKVTFLCLTKCIGKDKMINALRKECKNLQEEESNAKTGLLLKYIRCHFLSSLFRRLKNKQLSNSFMIFKGNHLEYTTNQDIGCHQQKNQQNKKIVVNDRDRKCQFMLKSLKMMFTLRQLEFNNQQFVSKSGCLDKSMRVCERIIVSKKNLNLNLGFYTIKDNWFYNCLKFKEIKLIQTKNKSKHDFEVNKQKKWGRVEKFLVFIKNFFFGKQHYLGTKQISSMKIMYLMKISERRWESKYRENEAINQAKMEFFETKNSELSENFETVQSEYERQKLENEKLMYKLEELRSVIDNKDTDGSRREAEHKTRIMDIMKEIKRLKDELNKEKQDNESSRSEFVQKEKNWSEEEKRFQQQVNSLQSQIKNSNEDKNQLVAKLGDSLQSTELLKKEYEKVNQKNESFKKQLRDKEIILNITKSETNDKGKESDEYKNKYHQVKSELEKYMNDQKKGEQKWRKDKNSIAKLNSDAEGLTAEQIRLNGEKAEWVSETDDLKRELIGYKKKEPKIKESLRRMEEVENDLEIKTNELQLQKQTSENLKKNQKDLDNSKEQNKKADDTLKEELSSYQKMVADLNREKVNMMRDMTLLHDKYKAEQNEANKYKNIAKESQNEVEKTQMHLEMLMQAFEQKEAKSKQKSERTGIFDLNQSTYSRTSSQNNKSNNISNLNTTGKGIDQSRGSDKINNTINNDDSDDNLNDKIKQIRAKYDI